MQLDDFIDPKGQARAADLDLHLVHGAVTVTGNGVSVVIDGDNPHTCIISEAIRCLACEGIAIGLA